MLSVVSFTFTPTPSPGTIAYGDSIAVRVQTSVGTLAHVVICASFSDGGDGIPELVFDNVRGVARFVGPYDNVGAIFTQSTTSDWTITFKRTNGWDFHGLPQFRLSVTATNNAGASDFVNSLDYALDPDPTDPPTVENFDPVDASLVTFDATVAFDVTSDVASIDQVEAWATFSGDEGRRELIIRGDASGPPDVFDPYILVSTGGISNGRHFEVSRGGDGWFDDFVIDVVGTHFDRPDDEGSGSASYVRSPPATPADTTSPIVGSVVPAPGTPIASTDPLQLDVTDDSGAFRRILIAVVLGGVTELAHDGSSFLGNYAGGSCSRTAISGGFRFVILRDGGWPSSPSIRIFAIDLSGNEA